MAAGLATSSEDQTVRLWDAESGQEVLTLRGHTDIVPSVAFSPDGNRLVSAGADGTVQIREAEPSPATAMLNVAQQGTRMSQANLVFREPVLAARGWGRIRTWRGSGRAWN